MIFISFRFRFSRFSVKLLKETEIKNSNKIIRARTEVKVLPCTIFNFSPPGFFFSPRGQAGEKNPTCQEASAEGRALAVFSH